MPEDTRTLPPVVVNGVRPPDRDAFVSSLPPTVSPPASYPRDVIEISPTDPIPNPIVNPCVARLVADIVNADYPEGIGEEGMQALRALAKAQAAALYNNSYNNGGEFVEWASYLWRNADGTLSASEPLTSNDPVTVGLPALNDLFSELGAQDTIVGVIHTHSTNPQGRGGIASLGDKNFKDRIRERLNSFPQFNSTIDDNPVMYIIDQYGIVREYNWDQVSSITGNLVDRFGARVDDDGTLDISTDCEES